MGDDNLEELKAELANMRAYMETSDYLNGTVSQRGPIKREVQELQKRVDDLEFNEALSNKGDDLDAGKDVSGIRPELKIIDDPIKEGPTGPEGEPGVDGSDEPVGADTVVGPLDSDVEGSEEAVATGDNEAGE